MSQRNEDADRRALICFRTPRDSVLVSQMLERDAVQTQICANLSELCAEAGRGVGCMVIGEESITADSAKKLHDLLADQPNWSEIPVIIVVPRRTVSRPLAPPLQNIQNVSVLESPIGVTAFNSTVRVALASRERQLAVRGHIEERERAVTQRDEALEELEKSRALLVAENRGKDEFLATLAHELRNPLAPIRNGVAVIAQIPGRDEKVEWARAIIERQVVTLSRLVDDLLDVSRLSRGKVTLQLRQCAVKDLLNAAVETSAPGVEQAGLTLRVAPVDPSLHIQVDPLRIAQALSNLLNNAVKFTPQPGQIELAAERVGDQVVFHVKDSGIGIAPENLDQVFGLFSQVGARSGQPNAGLGIGLTLVRSFARLHGGDARAESQGLGQGSEFFLSLPVYDPKLAPHQPLENAPGAPSVKQDASSKLGRIPSGQEFSHDAKAKCPLRILLVDDNIDAAQSLKLLFDLMGEETRLAFDGASAIKENRAFKPHLVVMDLGLPQMDGFAAGKAIRQESPRCVLVASSGWGREQDRVRTTQAGFDHHFVKPVDIDRFTELLHEIRTEALSV